MRRRCRVSSKRVLAVICGEPVRITGAGRTDAGVHASGQVIDLRTTSGLATEELERGVNALLPEDIAISSSSQRRIRSTRGSRRRDAHMNIGSATRGA
jgi:tRNA pseudouridine38-40 synthase